MCTRVTGAKQAYGLTIFSNRTLETIPINDHTIGVVCRNIENITEHFFYFRHSLHENKVNVKLDPDHLFVSYIRNDSNK